MKERIIMTGKDTCNKLAASIILLLIAGVCAAEYDLYCIGSSYIMPAAARSMAT